MDALYLFAILVFAGLTVALAAGCAKLGARK